MKFLTQRVFKVTQRRPQRAPPPVLIIALVGIFILRAVGRLVLLGVPGRILGIPGRSTSLRIGCLVFTVIVLRHNSSHSAV